MDRVLLIIDDIQYAGHLEATLRKVGFDMETITTEITMPEKLITFNPDYIIVKGTGSRVSTDSVGKKLKETTKFLGKVILVFPQNQKATPDDLIKLRMDVLLFEPISALRLVNSLLSLTSLDKDAIFDKLLRLAQTDPQFRHAESEILKGSGVTLDTEIKLITGRGQLAIEPEVALNEEDILNFIKPEVKMEAKGSLQPSPEYKQALNKELEATEALLPQRIESYNSSIKTIDQDLKSGHKKRQTRSMNIELFKKISDEDTLLQDEERKKFVTALVKK